MRDAQLLHDLFKRITVFRALDGFHVRADDFHGCANCLAEGLENRLGDVVAVRSVRYFRVEIEFARRRKTPQKARSDVQGLVISLSIEP